MIVNVWIIFVSDCRCGSPMNRFHQWLVNDVPIVIYVNQSSCITVCYLQHQDYVCMSHSIPCGTLIPCINSQTPRFAIFSSWHFLKAITQAFVTCMIDYILTTIIHKFLCHMNAINRQCHIACRSKLTYIHLCIFDNLKFEKSAFLKYGEMLDMIWVRYF